MFGLNPMELMIVGAIAVLLFGNKLPSVARSLGKSMTEFKKGITDIQEEVRSAGSTTRSTQQVSRYHEIDDREEATAPKFEPPAAEPAIDAGEAKPVEA
jgi:sec-independent protein translocase protein TatA